MKVRAIKTTPSMLNRGFKVGDVYEAFEIIDYDLDHMVFYEIVNPDPTFVGHVYGYSYEAPLGSGHWRPDHFEVVEDDPSW